MAKRPTQVKKEQAAPFFIRPFRPKTETQSRYLQAIKESEIIFCIGPAGAGKSYVAANAALNMLLNGEVQKIVLTRPIIATEDIGYLPGTEQEKLAPYMRPLVESLEAHIGPTMVKDLMADGKIEICALAFLRGRSLNDCVTGDSTVLLSDGTQIRFDELVPRWENGEQFSVKSYNHDTGEIEDSPISFAFKTQPSNKLFKLTLSDGTVLKVTADHKLFVEGKDYLPANQMKIGDILFTKS